MVYAILASVVVAPAAVFSVRRAQRRVQRRAQRARIDEIWRATDAARENRTGRH